MKVFCSQCGAPNELERPQSEPVKCGACGKLFELGGTQVRKKGMSGWVIGLLIALVALPCIGLPVAVVLPGFMTYQPRSLQSECRSNLKSFFTAEKSYFSERDEYSPLVRKVGFVPERGNRYLYLGSREGTVEDRSGSKAVGAETDVGVNVDSLKYPGMALVPAALPPLLAGGVRLGVTGECPKCEMTMACVGNIDRDATLDVWSISTVERKAADGEVIQAGQPYNDVSDAKF
jgi:hypothetical protein